MLVLSIKGLAFLVSYLLLRILSGDFLAVGADVENARGSKDGG